MADYQKITDAPQPTVICPACGAQVPSTARFCGDCGAEVIPSEVAVNAPLAPAPFGSVEPTEDGKLCNWCRAMSPKDALRCVNCDAMFPTPEGDEAVERAARERIEDLNEDIRKIRASNWWPFRSR